ncbi:MAG: FCD domain-containing protein, partial [Pseudomonadota bacterium]
LDEATLSALGASLQTMEQLSQKGEAVAMIEEDMAFHRIVVAASGNRRFLSLFDQIAGEMRFGVAVIGRLYDDPCEIAATHRPLLEAIAKGTGVREAFVYHIETARHHVVALYRAIEET